MANKGLWQKENYAGKFKFFAGIIVLLAAAVSLPFLYGTMVKTLDHTVVPEMLKNQMEMLKNYRYYIWSQWFGKNLLQMGSIIAIFMGGSLISGETSRKTIQFLLARPISRRDIFKIKYISTLASIVLMVLVSTLGLYIAIIASGRAYDLSGLMENMVMAVAGLAVVYSLAVYFSTVFDQTAKACVVSGFIAVVLSIPGYFAGIQEYSIYYQMRGVSIFTGTGFPFLALIILLAITILLYNLGVSRMTKKDL